MRTITRKVLGAGSVIVLATLATASTAQAVDLSVPIDTVITTGVPAGVEAPLTEVAAGELTGATCSVRSVRDNATEVNRGNDVVVRSGSARTVLRDVERTTDAITEGSDIVLADVIEFAVVMGPDEAFAGDLVIEFDCVPPPRAVAAPPAETSSPADSPADAAPADEAPATEDEPVALPVTGSATTITALLAVMLCSAGTSLWLLAQRRIAD